MNTYFKFYFLGRNFKENKYLGLKVNNKMPLQFLRSRIKPN